MLRIAIPVDMWHFVEFLLPLHVVSSALAAVRELKL